MFPPRDFLLWVAALAALGCARARASEVWPAGVAGTWYPEDAEALRTQVQKFLDGARPAALATIPAALVVPHAGFVYSGQTAAWGYALLAAPEAARPTRVILLGPSHYTGFRGFTLPDARAWKTPLGEVPFAAKPVAALRRHKLAAPASQLHPQEHSLEAHLPFLQVALKRFELVPLLIGPRSEPDDLAAIAEAIRPYLDDRTLLVASSDFTHYGPRFRYEPFRDDIPARIRALDMAAIQRIQARDARGFALHIEATGDTVCGRQPISILLHALGAGAPGVLLHYDTSGAQTGDWTNSVSYATIAFPRAPAAPATRPARPARAPAASSRPRGRGDSGLDDRERESLLRLARSTLRSHLLADPSLSDFLGGFEPTGLLAEPSGVFVTLHRTLPEDVKRLGRLRGCIGSIFPTEPLYLGVVHNTINAASHDPRFEAVRPEEIDRLDLEITVLSPPRPVASPEQVIPGRHGVLLEKDQRRAVFLPQVATEQGWNLEALLENLCRKAGLSAGCWREGARLQVFTGQVFGEAAGARLEEQPQARKEAPR